MAGAERRKIVSRFPASGIVLGDDVEQTFLERLELGVGVAIIVEANLVKIPHSAIDHEIAPPIGGIAPERDSLARIDVADEIGSAANWRAEAGVFEGCGIDGVFG